MSESLPLQHRNGRWTEQADAPFVGYHERFPALPQARRVTGQTVQFPAAQSARTNGRSASAGRMPRCSLQDT